MQRLGHQDHRAPLRDARSIHAAAALQIVANAAPKETSTDRIERVLAEFAARRRTIRHSLIASGWPGLGKATCAYFCSVRTFFR
jgi:hypothetical protein